MAYDPATGNIVLFGGHSTSGSYLSDTWTYDASTDTWTEQSPSASPPARQGATMAYDPATGTMVLFGGFSASGSYLSDTWTYDASTDTWTEQFPSASPPARQGATMTFDPATGNMVLFGGYGSTSGVLNDTWTWNGTTWTQAIDAGCTSSCTDSPPARYFASMAYDPATGNMVLFGGYGSSGRLNDTWTWNGTTWTQAIDPACTSSCTGSPPARQGASMAFDPATGNMVLFGGYGSSGRLNDTWTWNGTTWTQAIDPGCTSACTGSPPARQDASMAYDPATGTMVLFGGYSSSGYLNDTWTYGYPPGTSTNWVSQTPASSPSGIYGASMAYDPTTGNLVLFGGSSSDGTWTYGASADTWTEQFLSPSPPARYFGSMAFDPATGTMVLFGGFSGSDTYHSGTWTYDASTDTWTEQFPSTSPPALYGATMAYDPTTGNLVLFGGSSASANYLNDTWTYDASTDTWTEQFPSTSPPAREGASMAFDPAAGAMVLFGGHASSGMLNDTWTYDASTDTWTEQSPSTSPRPRSGASMAFDPAIGTMVLFGGYNFSASYLNDTWTYDVSTDTWTEQFPSTSPPARDRASMAFDPAAGAMVLFGGEGSSSALSDTWTYVPAATVPGAPGAPTAVGGNTSAAVTWSAPSSDGGATITSYKVTAADSTTTTNGGQTCTTNGALTCSLTGLTNGDSYTFTVTAANSVGVGPASAASNTVTPTTPTPVATAPGAPTGLAATPGDAQVALSWTAPSSNGGSAITGYEVYQGTTSGAESSTPVNSSPLAASARSYTVSGLTNDTTYYFTVVAVNAVGSSVASNEAAATPSTTTTPGGHGYWEVASDGGVFTFGSAQFYGSMGGKHLNKPVVGIATTPGGHGYWEVASDGGVFTFGSAQFYGSMGGKHLNKPVVGIATTPGGHGYWEVASDGGIFTFGTAKFYGSEPGLPASARSASPVVGIAATGDGKGYWEVTSTGTVFAFGDARLYGSMAGKHLNKPIVGMTADPSTGGYWLVASDGGIFSFNATFEGSMGGKSLNKPIVGMAADPSTGGYWLVASDGGIFSFNTSFEGSMGGTPLNEPIVGMAATSS